ncbi:MAG: hypothetical protein WCO29_15815 [Nostocales cyanobacterium ELA583]|jgi:hypothetical protein
MARRRRFLSLNQKIRTLTNLRVKLLSIIDNYIRPNYDHLVKYLIRKKVVFFVLFLLLTFGVISFVAVLPATHIFEGDIFVEEMNFTYNGQQPKLFLTSIRNISNLEIEGIQNLTLTGKFKSTSTPQLNQSNELKFALIDSKSKLIISQLKPKNHLDINEFILQPNTKVNITRYDDYNKRFNFTLENKPNILQTSLGKAQLKISLEKYKLSDQNLSKNINPDIPLEFIFTPDNKELKFSLVNNSIYITISNDNQDNFEDWFRGKIESKEVQFQRLDRTGEIKDDLVSSTISEGKVRMIEQERDIKEHQFLMGENPDIPLNIELIRNINIVPKKGLEVRFTGRTKQIQIGLDKNFPVSRIQGSWLDSILPRDAIIAIFAFGAGTITSILSFVLENASQSNKTN